MLSSCVVLGKLLNLSVICFSNLQIGLEMALIVLSERGHPGSGNSVTMRRVCPVPG